MLSPEGVDQGRHSHSRLGGRVNGWGLALSWVVHVTRGGRMKSLGRAASGTDI